MAARKTTIEILGSLDGGDHYSEADIRNLLDEDKIRLERNTQFVGRLGTRLHRKDGAILKIREDMNLGVKTASRWVRENVVDRERLVNVHHPKKTWFLVYSGDQVSAGNIAPELRPLHIAIEESKDGDWCVDQLAEIVDLYAGMAIEHNLRADEGLSNFGFDDQGKIYYLDDDIYRWDRFIGFCQGIGLYMRTIPQIDEAGWKKLGARVAEIWVKHHPDPHSPRMIARHIRQLPVVNDTQTASRNALVDGLESLDRAARKKRKAAKVVAMTFEEVMSADRVAVIADIHSNAPALQVVMDKLKEEGVTAGVVLGDVVGYGPHPRECIDIIRKARFAVLKGNHDHATASGFIGPGVNAPAKWVIEWSRELLKKDELEWLDNLPDSMQAGEHFAVHGSPMDPHFFYGYVYRTTATRNLDYLSEHHIRRCYHGHSHMAAVYFRDKEGVDGRDNESAHQDIGSQSHSLICPGSVGKTRSGRPGAEMAIFDQPKNALNFEHLDYPLDETVADMERLNFPSILLERLRTGA